MGSYSTQGGSSHIHTVFQGWGASGYDTISGTSTGSSGWGSFGSATVPGGDHHHLVSEHATLLGGASTDFSSLLGGSAVDTLIGGSGVDSLTGGSVTSAFDFHSASKGASVITNFVSGHDTLFVDGHSLAFTETKGHVTAGTSGSTFISLHGSTTIELKGVSSEITQHKP